MNKEQALRDTTDNIIEIIGMPEDVIPEYYDDFLTDLEMAFESGGKPDPYFEDLLEESFAEPSDYEAIIKAFDDGYAAYISDKLGENMKNDDFERIFEGTQTENKRRIKNAISEDDGPFDSWNPGQVGKSATIKPKIRGTPHFQYNDGGYGPIPTTGVGKRDYEVKYSRTGSLTEGKVSPALKEAISSYETRKKLIENQIIDEDDFDILED